MIWTDNMVIPKGAANMYTAELMMDFVYDPTIAAQIANYVYYVSPVKGADEAIKPSSTPRRRRTRSSSRPPRSSPSSTTSSSCRPSVESKMNELFADLAGDLADPAGGRRPPR